MFGVMDECSMRLGRSGSERLRQVCMSPRAESLLKDMSVEELAQFGA